MDNNKKNVHNSGPLGILVKSGQVKKVDFSEPYIQASSEESTLLQKNGSSYFKTEAGIEFTHDELIFVDPNECEPWGYANRGNDELGDIDSLVESIKSNKQLQPALIRKHPQPHDDIKYEIIFGRRRHIACQQLGIPFLAIYKAITNDQDAVASQDAENKLRNNVSNYSNAKLYQKLLEDRVFKTEKELSQKLNMSSSSLNDLMSFAKLPDDIVTKIPNIHGLSQSIAIKLLNLLNNSKENHEKILVVADQIGKSITSPSKLAYAIDNLASQNIKRKPESAKYYVSYTGKKLFTFKITANGTPCITINKKIANNIDFEEVCNQLCKYLEASFKTSQDSE